MTMKLTGRPEKTIDAMTGPLAQFGLDVKAVRWRAGRPTYEVMSAATGISVGALSEAALGRSCPSWRTLCAYLDFCGVDPQDWRPRWEMLASPEQRMAAGFPVRPDQRRAAKIMTPAAIRTPEDFALGLRHLRCLNGNPPLKQIAARSGWAISTIHKLLAPGRTTVPNFDLAMDFVRVFVTSAEELRAWRRAWSDLRVDGETRRAAA
jgi:hypothetical protein